uniref:Uncharacterized protein n=1 Tax=Anguilla anguilla TaxID=7936 RepID=A0A0E9XLP9_ANGAN
MEGGKFYSLFIYF